MKILALFLTIFFASCSSVSITERKQLIILGDDVIYPQAFKAYKDFKSKAKLIEDGEDLENINKVTEKLKLAIKKYYQSICLIVKIVPYMFKPLLRQI